MQFFIFTIVASILAAFTGAVPVPQDTATPTTTSDAIAISAVPSGHHCHHHMSMSAASGVMPSGHHCHKHMPAMSTDTVLPVATGASVADAPLPTGVPLPTNVPLATPVPTPVPVATPIPTPVATGA